MRKKILLVIILVLVVAALFLLGASGSKTTDTDSTGGTTNTQPTLSIEQQMAAQRRAMEASAAITEIFLYNGWTGRAKPEYYGGMYIEDNKLYVQVNPSYTREVEFFKGSLIAHKDVIVYEETQYSWTMRCVYTDYLASALKAQGYRVTEWGPSSGNREGFIGVFEEDLEAATAKVEQLQKQIWGAITPPRVEIEKGSYQVLQ